MGTLGRRYHIYYGPDKNLMPTDEVCPLFLTFRLAVNY